MFRNFYAEQNMADPRDSWYKPNLLYNIHYRPHSSPTPPKMMVVTREFNASVCSCGEHGCTPHYRMEWEVVWSNKEVKKEEESEVSKGKIQDDREVSTKTEGIDAEIIEDDGDGDDDDDRDASDDDDDDDDDHEEENNVKRKSDTDNVNVSTSNGEKLIEKKHDITNVPRSDDLPDPETPDIDVLDIEERTVYLDGDIEEFGSCFGIMRVYCDSEMHISWNGNNKFHGH